MIAYQSRHVYIYVSFANLMAAHAGEANNATALFSQVLLGRLECLFVRRPMLVPRHAEVLA